MAVQRVVGRDGDIAALEGAWRRLAADPGSGPVVAVVSGTAGVGKTTLVTAALERIAPEAGAVLRGCGLPDRPAPHDWTAQALTGLTTGDVPAARLDAYRALTQQPGPLPQFPPRALLRAGVDLVRLALGAGPGVLVAEDLHALDGASLTLLGELSRAVSLPALLVVTTREADAAAEPRLLAELLSILPGRPGLVRLHLDPLTPAQVAELLADHLGDLPQPALVRAVHRRTGGLPFWVGELLAAAGPNPRQLVDGPLPEHLAGLVRSRLGGEDEVVLRVAGGAALLGEHVYPDTVAEVCDLPPGVVRGAVDRLAARGLLTVDADSRPRFRHALAREAVAEGVLPAARRQVYERALAAAQHSGDDAGVARYARAAGRPELVPAAALRAARRELAAGRPEPAHRLAALALGDADGPPGGERLALTAVAARAAHAAGAFERSGRYARSWLAAATRAALHPADDPGDGDTHPSAALRLLAELAWRAGRVAEQWQHLDRALDLAEPGSREWVRCLAARAQALMRAERNAEAVEAAERALAAGRAIGYAEVEPGLLVDKGTALWGLGERADAVALLEEARLRAEAERDLVTLGRALNNLAMMRSETLPPDAAWRFHEEVTAQAERWGVENSLGKICRCGVELALSEGDLDRAWSVVWTRLPVETDPVERVVLAVKAGLLAVERGEDARAARLLERCEPDAQGMDQPWVRTYVALLRVAVAARTGPAAAARAALYAYRDCVAPAGHAMRAHRLGEALRWALDAGVPPAQARAVLAECLPGVALRSGSDGPNGTAGPGRVSRVGRNDGETGHVHDAGGQLAAAECALLEVEGDDEGAVVAGLAGLDAEWFQAHLRADVHVRLARCLARLRRSDEAREHAAAALDLLRRWPGWRRREAERVTGQVADAGAPAAALTTREVDVVRLVSQGLTNHQVGRALGISARTVAVHVSSVLAKTGCASRTEAALWAVRHGLASG